MADEKHPVRNGIAVGVGTAATCRTIRTVGSDGRRLAGISAPSLVHPKARCQEP